MVYNATRLRVFFPRFSVLCGQTICLVGCENVFSLKYH